MTGYEFWKILHVVAAAAWFGAGVLLNVLMGRLSAQKQFDTVAGVTKNGSFIERFFDVAAILTLTFGVIMVLISDSLSFGDPFISVGFLGIIITLGIGHAIIGPTIEKLREALETGNAEAAQTLGPKIGMYSMIDSLVLVFVIAVMVLKPAWW